jgi:polar amino acid transport system substrate-binding protein
MGFHFPRGFFCRLALLFALVAGAAGCREKTNGLVVGMELSYPPFETIDPAGDPAGVSVDLAKALGDWLGRPVRIENIPFTGLIPSLKTGKIDCIISSMTDTPERRGSIDFSEPYLSTGLALLVPAGSAVQSVADLDQTGKTVAVRQGTTGEVWARANIKNAKILGLEKESAAVMEVVQGKADAFLYDQMSVWENARRHPEKTRAVLQPIRKEDWAVGLRKGDDALRAKVNEFLREFRASGGFERLGEKYLKQQKEAFREQGIEFYF